MLINRRRLISGAALLSMSSSLPGYATRYATGSRTGAQPIPGKHLYQTSGRGETWLEISAGSCRRNLDRVKAMLTPGARVCAVVKADAYGNGIDCVVPTLIDCGIETIGLVTNEEAARVRSLGYRGKILRLRPGSRGETIAALELGVIELVGSLDAAKEQATAWRPGLPPLDVHLALDAGGMSRDGLSLATAGGLTSALKILALPQIRVTGLMTHFPMESEDDILQVLASFRAEAQKLIDLGRLDRRRLTVHAANSAATVRVSQSHLDMVRVGSALYGDLLPNAGFEKTMALRSQLVAINNYPTGATVGYNRTATLKRSSRLGLVPCGYANGYRRSLSNRAQVIVGGRKVPVLGRVSMNSMVVDLTDAADASVGDTVTLFGRQGDAEISQEEIEASSGTIMAELLVQWGEANQRVLVG